MTIFQHCLLCLAIPLLSHIHEYTALCSSECVACCDTSESITFFRPVRAQTSITAWRRVTLYVITPVITSVLHILSTTVMFHTGTPTFLSLLTLVLSLTSSLRRLRRGAATCASQAFSCASLSAIMILLILKRSHLLILNLVTITILIIIPIFVSMPRLTVLIVCLVVCLRRRAFSQTQLILFATHTIVIQNMILFLLYLSTDSVGSPPSRKVPSTALYPIFASALFACVARAVVLFCMSSLVSVVSVVLVRSWLTKSHFRYLCDLTEERLFDSQSAKLSFVLLRRIVASSRVADLAPRPKAF